MRIFMGILVAIMIIGTVVTMAGFLGFVSESTYVPAGMFSCLSLMAFMACYANLLSEESSDDPWGGLRIDPRDDD